MKEKVKIAILLFFVSFLSVLNLKNGLHFKTTDNTEKDAVFSTPTIEPEKIKATSTKLKTVNIPSTPVKTTAKTTVKVAIKKTSGPKTLNLLGVSTVRNKTGCENSMPVRTVGANYCNFYGGDSIFIYGHNRAGTFNTLYTLKAGDYIKIKIDSKVRTYKVMNTFRKTKKELNSNTDLTVSIIASNYGNKWGKTSFKDRITFQTCEGQNDIYRRYIQAVRV